MRIRYEYQEGDNHLYAIGENSVVRTCCTITFSQLGWNEEWKGDTLWHYTGGWFDRSISWYNRSNNISPDPGPFADHIYIDVGITNNPFVNLIKIGIYQKIDASNKNRIQQKIANFYECLIKSFDLFEVRLVTEENWDEVKLRHPNLRCSPVWRTGEFTGEAEQV